MRSLDPLGYQQITSLAAATGLTVPAGTEMALIQAEAQNVRWRDDGSNPTAAAGMILMQGAVLEYDAVGLASVKFIETVAGAILNVSYYGVNTV